LSQMMLRARYAMKPSILIVDDEESVRWSLGEALSETGYKVDSAQTGEEALAKINRTFPDLMLLDIMLPKADGLSVLRDAKRRRRDLVAIMITGHSAVDTAVQAMKLGAYDYVDKPFDIEKLRGLIAEALDQAPMRREAGRERDEDRIVYVSEAMREVCELVDMVCQTEDTTVLIHGESGTGKELIARAIHSGSSRADKPFVAINCTALPEHLLESELFGHERGAFTDAKSDKMGLFELADGGTLFLDEIGDMGKAMQAKLLRVLEERSFRRIGSTKQTKVDIRVIASTNRDLLKAMKEGDFRKDLYYRLMVVPIHLPPLRERKSDILPLARYFLEEFARRSSRGVPSISDEAAAMLESYSWPGNVRELRNAIERAMIFGRGDEIRREHLTFWHKQDDRPVNEITPGCSSLEEAEQDFIRRTLESVKWNKNLAAKVLRINRTTLYKKIKRYGLAPEPEAV